jgi:hypothetical protein
MHWWLLRKVRLVGGKVNWVNDHAKTPSLNMPTSNSELESELQGGGGSVETSPSNLTKMHQPLGCHTSFLHLIEVMFPFLIRWQMNGEHKASPWWVNSICQEVVHVVQFPILHEIASMFPHPLVSYEPNVICLGRLCRYWHPASRSK